MNSYTKQYEYPVTSTYNLFPTHKISYMTKPDGEGGYGVPK